MAKKTKAGPRVLIVDDDMTIATMFVRALSRRNYNVEATSSTDEALAWSQARGYDAALLDLVMPERDGMSLATALRVHQPALPIAILTGYTNSPLLEDAARARIAVIKKPVATQDLVDFLETHTGT